MTSCLRQYYCFFRYLMCLMLLCFIAQLHISFVLFFVGHCLVHQRLPRVLKKVKLQIYITLVSFLICCFDLKLEIIFQYLMLILINVKSLYMSTIYSQGHILTILSLRVYGVKKYNYHSHLGVLEFQPTTFKASTYASQPWCSHNCFCM